MTLDLIKKLARAELMFATVNRAGRIGRPLLARFLLFVSDNHSTLISFCRKSQCALRADETVSSQ